MARGVNKAVILGNVGQVNTMSTKEGKLIVSVSVATSEVWKDQQGHKQEKTEWHQVVIFGKLAEVANQYVHKGSKVFIEGKMATRKWTGDDDGITRYRTEVIVDAYSGTLLLLDSKQGQQLNPADYPAQMAQQEPKPMDAPNDEKFIDPNLADHFDDKIPF